MGKHADYLKTTSSVLRKALDEGAANYVAADAAVSEAEDREARQEARDKADLGSKFPALEKR